MSGEAVRFQLGDIVYLRIDPEEKGMVTGITYRPTGVLYQVAWGTSSEHPHYDIELTTEAHFSESKL